jgi:2-polyprenyl-3-methyl-5-hydroxy-6-metoxy-1,4-benzoquinol methylase
MDIEEYSKIKHFYTGVIPELLARYLDKNTWKSFLDVGCGDGSLLYALNKKGYFNDKNVYAIDLSKNRIDLCKKINQNFRCFVNSAGDMKAINDDSINFLVSTQVIEHVQSDDELIKELARVLEKNNNIVYLSTVFKKWYGWYFYRCNKKWTLDPTHLREYTKDNQLLDIFKKYDFEIIECKKSLLWFTISYFFMRRMHYKSNRINNPFLKFISLFKVPIIGYYNWEIICSKNLKC